MSKKEELKRLEGKIESLSKQLHVTQKRISKLQRTLIGVTSSRAKWIEERRKEAEKTEKKHEIMMYYRSLAMGLTLGIIGNMFASYLLKALEIFDIPSLTWLLLTFSTLAGIIALIWSYDREIKKLSKEIVSS